MALLNFGLATPGLRLGSAPVGETTQSLSLAATKLGFGFWVPEDKTLSTGAFRFTAKSGTLASTDILLEIYSATSAGIPSAALSSTNTVSPAITAGSYGTFSGLTQSITNNTQYYGILSNTNAIPASNNCTVGFGTNYLDPGYGGNFSGTTQGMGWMKVLSTDSGATWAGGSAASSAGILLGFSDGTYAGFGWGGTNQPETSATTTCYLTNEVGCRFQIDANVTLNVVGISFFMRKSGSPTGNLTFKLYPLSGNKLAETAPINAAMLATGQVWTTSYFPGAEQNPIQVVGGTPYRISIADSVGNSDSTTNYFTFPTVSIANNAAAKSLSPYSQQLCRTADGTASPPTWTDTDTKILGAFLLLQDGSKFALTSSNSTVYVF